MILSSKLKQSVSSAVQSYGFIFNTTKETQREVGKPELFIANLSLRIASIIPL
jgi:hypothetical protein